MEDPLKSRLSWEDVYLHPLFKGEFHDIARSVGGSEILRTLMANAKSKNKNLDLKKVLY